MGFLASIVAKSKYRNKRRGPFGAIQKFSENVIVPKKIEVQTSRKRQRGSLVCCRGSGCRFCFFLFVLDERSSGSSVVQVVEQKSGPYAAKKKLPTVRVGHFSPKAPTNKSSSDFCLGYIDLTLDVLSPV